MPFRIRACTDFYARRALVVTAMVHDDNSKLSALQAGGREDGSRQSLVTRQLLSEGALPKLHAAEP